MGLEWKGGCIRGEIGMVGGEIGRVGRAGGD